MMRCLLVIVMWFVTLPVATAGGYIFYLHGRIVEEQGPNAVETSRGYGAYEYDKILDAFRKQGFTVISECRPSGTDVKVYARKVARQADSLLKNGVQPGDITIIGASKGSVIAQYASTYMHNTAVNYVFMGGCGEGIEHSNPEINYCGNILSIFESSDDIGSSCNHTKSISKLKVPHYKEIKLQTGLKHGFLYRPIPEWVTPATNWAKGHFN